MKRPSTTVAALLAAGFLLQSQPLSTATNAPPKLNIQETPLSREVKATSFAPVIRKVGPSVVNIFSSMTIKERPMRNPLLDDPFLRRFFGEDFGDQSQPREHKAQSLGSGVIVSADGYVLTANHVVEGADKVKVALASGQGEFEAKIIGTDPLTDIAVLKVDAKNLPGITIADSDKLEVGDIVLAIGNPFAVGQTVTMGIVSGLRRGGLGITDYESFIQTDAAINMGNSGGALVDAEGRLVGINTAILSPSGGNLGVGFAVPINLARYVMDHITKEGKVTRGYLGMLLQPEMTQDLAKQFNLPDINGALVTRVEPDSPAAKAGIKEGDFVVEFNGKKVADMHQLRLLASQTTPGTKVNLRVIRDGKEKNFTPTLAEMPEQLLARSGKRTQQGQRGPSSTDALDGVEVTDLDASIRRQAVIPKNVHSAFTSTITPLSKAAQAVLRTGDGIVEINRQPVRNAEEAVAFSEKAKGDRILLLVWSSGGRGSRGGTHYVVVDNTKRK